MQELPDKFADRPVDLWLIDLTRAGPALCALEDSDPRLPPDQRAHIMASASAERRQKRLAAHIVLRLALERVAGRLPVSRVAFDTTTAGKPALPCGGPAFSISYARGHLLIGINARGPIGVDMERPRPAKLTSEKRAGIIAVAAALCPGQTLPARDMKGSESDAAQFLQSWTRLEAVSKATGQGIISLLGLFGLVGADTSPKSRDAAAVAAFLKSHSLRVADLDIPECLECPEFKEPESGGGADAHFAAVALGHGQVDVPVPVWLPCDSAGLGAFGSG